MSDNTFFDLPNVPDEFGVSLPLPNLRRINYSALEFETIRRALVEYIRTYYPDKFNDFVANNGVIMIMELVSFVGSVMSQHSDIIADESFLPSAQSFDAVVQHLKLINRSIKRQTPANVDVAISLQLPTSTAIKINPGLVFNIVSPDGRPLTYELYRAPNDYTSPIEIPSGKRGVIAFGIEGKFADVVSVLTSGGPDQIVTITDDDIIDDPIFIDVVTGTSSFRWTRVKNLESASANDTVYEVSFTETGVDIKFGNDVNGKALLSGQVVNVSYRKGGGSRGRIPAGAIDESRPITPVSPNIAAIDVVFRNLLPSSGGRDTETIEEAKKNAPKEAATLYSATSGEDYAVLASQFSHPVYGSVSKAVTALKTSLNANIIELYVLADGTDDTPSLPSTGLKQGLKTYFDNIKVITDEVRVLDGAIKAVDLTATIVISKNVNPGIIRDKVDSALDSFFSATNREMGEPLYLARLYEILQQIDGVKFVDIFTPKDNILPTSEAADPDAYGVGFNELIVLGQKKIDYYYEK